MQIGKRWEAKTNICTADEASIEVHGRDLVNDLMGKVNFTEFFYLMVTGQTPTETQRFFLDLLLVAIAEHGLTPTAQAARMTYDAAPDSLQGALAAGILGCGSVVMGTAEICAQALVSARALEQENGSTREAARQTVNYYLENGGKMPGFGHPLHHPVDPRAERIIALADEHKISGPHLTLAREMIPFVQEAWPGKSLPMNVSMPIAAVLLDLDFPASMAKAIPLLARTAGLLGHLAEEQQRPIGFLMAHHAELNITYEKKDT